MLTGKRRRTRGKTCPSAILYTTNLAWTDLLRNSGFRIERRVTNSLKHCLAKIHFKLFSVVDAGRSSHKRKRSCVRRTAQQVFRTARINTTHKYGVCANCTVARGNLVVHLVTTTGEEVNIGVFYRMYVRFIYRRILSEIQYQEMGSVSGLFQTHPYQWSCPI